MGILCALYAAGLALWAWRTQEPRLRPWLIGFALLNLLALGQMAAQRSPYLFHLMDADPDEPPEPAWRR